MPVARAKAACHSWSLTDGVLVAVDVTCLHVHATVFHRQDLAGLQFSQRTFLPGRGDDRSVATQVRESRVNVFFWKWRFWRQGVQRAELPYIRSAVLVELICFFGETRPASAKPTRPARLSVWCVGARISMQGLLLQYGLVLMLQGYTDASSPSRRKGKPPQTPLPDQWASLQRDLRGEYVPTLTARPGILAELGM